MMSATDNVGDSTDDTAGFHPFVCTYEQMQGLRLKSEGGKVAVPIYEDQLMPREVVGLPAPATQLSCAHFHTAVLTEEAHGSRSNTGGGGVSSLHMFGMAAASRTQHHDPCPVPLPSGDGGGGDVVDSSEWELSSSMARTVLACPSQGTAFSTSFEGPSGESEWVREGHDREAERGVPLRVRAVLSGLEHRLLLVEE